MAPRTSAEIEWQLIKLRDEVKQLLGRERKLRLEINPIPASAAAAERKRLARALLRRAMRRLDRMTRLVDRLSELEKRQEPTRSADSARDQNREIRESAANFETLFRD